MDDQAIGALLRRDFLRPIHSIARTDHDRLSPESSLAKVLATAVEKDRHVIPICDEDNRLKGLVSADDLLRGLVQGLFPKDSKSGVDSKSDVDGVDDESEDDSRGNADGGGSDG